MIFLTGRTADFADLFVVVAVVADPVDLVAWAPCSTDRFPSMQLACVRSRGLSFSTDSDSACACVCYDKVQGQRQGVVVVRDDIVS
jgi:hypothetical protein